MNTQKGFAPILLILLGIVIIGVGVYVYTQNNFEETIEDSQDFVMGGIWKFEEVFPTPSLDGVTSPVWEYTLSIDMEDETKGTLHIDGYQTIARLNVRIEKLNDSANIILGSYGRDNQFETYKKGDLLITVSPDIDRNLMTIDWYKMQPNVEESKFNAIFVRTSTQIENQEVATEKNKTNKTYSNESFGYSFDYNKDLSVQEVDQVVYINGLSDTNSPRLTITPNDNNVTLESEYNKCVNYKFTNGYGKSNIGGLDSFWCSTSEMGAYYSIVVTAQYIYKFDNFGLWKSSKIIDSFKFLK